MPTTTVPYTGFTASDQPATVTTTTPNATQAPVSTSAPAANPTAPVPAPGASPQVPAPAVYNATPAINQANNAQSIIDNNNTALATKNAAAIANPTPVPTPSTPQTLQTPSALPPAAAGMKYLYRTSDGAPVLFPLAANASGMGGYSDTPISTPNVNGSTVTDKVINNDGTQVQQLSNGTYVNIDKNGNVVSAATLNDFTNAQSNSNDYINKQQSQAMVNVSNQLDTLRSNLSANYQSQIDGVKQQLTLAIQQQQLVNQNLTGGTTSLMALYGQGGQIGGLATIAQTITNGIAAVSDLNAKAQDVINKMTEAFNTNNMQLLKESFNEHQAIQTQVQNQINKMHDDATSAAKDTRDYNQRVQVDQENQANNLRTYNLNVQKENNQVTEFGITANRENRLANSQIIKNSLESKKLQTEINGLNQSNAAMNNISGGTTNDSFGQPDPAKQAQYLQNVAKINPGLALAVKSAANYTLDPSQFASMRTDARQKFIEQVLQYDPSFDQAQYKARAAYIKNLDSGAMSQGILSANKSINHLITFADTVASLNNSSFSSTANAVGNTIEKPFNNKLQQNLKEANTESTGLKDELAKFFKGTGTTDVKSIDDWGKALDVNATPSEQKGTVQGALNLLAGQLDVMNQQYKSTMGKDPSNIILQPTTVAKLSTLKNQGYKVDIPGVYYTDPKTYISNNSNNAQYLKQTIAQYPNLSQEDALQQAQYNQEHSK
jgi:hypothetical protein